MGGGGPQHSERPRFSAGGRPVEAVRGLAASDQRQGGRSGAVGNAAPSPDGKDSPKPKVKPAPKAKVVDTATKLLNAKISDASKVKMLYIKSTSSGRALLENIETCPAYAWALNDQNKGQLEKLIAKVDTGLGSFHREFLLQESRFLKNKYSTDRLIALLTEFMDIKPIVTELCDRVDEILSMHGKVRAVAPVKDSH